MTIKVLLVDDSALALAILKRVLATAPDIEVAGTAKDGREALDLIPRLNPAVVCTDLHMPGMDGLELTRQIMDRFPRPVLVVSVSVENNSQNVFKLLEAGALDVFSKPVTGSEEEYLKSSQELVEKIRVLSGVHVFRRRSAVSAKADSENGVSAALRIVAFGASTGGPMALETVFSKLPAGFPVPILCVQHISSGFLAGLVEWLSRHCPLQVKVFEPDEFPLPGRVYFAAEGGHMEVDGQGRLVLSRVLPENGHRPSISATFRSVARYYGKSAAGVLLTGMGDDGADGLKAIADVDGVTIAQNEETSVVFGMSRQAIQLGAAKYVLPLDKIADTLIDLLSRGTVK